jgi:hypothetical protein
MRDMRGFAREENTLCSWSDRVSFRPHEWRNDRGRRAYSDVRKGKTEGTLLVTATGTLAGPALAERS